MKKLVVFDVDGTILDSVSFILETFVIYSKNAGLPHPNLEAMKLGYSEPYKYDFGWGVDKDEQYRHLNQCYKFMDSRFENHIPELYSDVVDTLKEIKSHGISMAIITSKPKKYLLNTLEHHAIDRLFSTHRNLDDVKIRNEREKPYPDMLLSVMKELNFAAEDTVMVGDTYMDVQMGKNAGTGTIGVTWGVQSKDSVMGANPDHILENTIKDILPLIA